MKILIIRFSSIGDIVLTTPVIRCLKTQIPSAEIHFLSKQSFKAVTEHNPYINKFYYYNKNLNQLIKQFKKEEYDYVVDLHKNFRSFRICLSLKSKILSYKKLSVQKFLLTKLGINIMPKIHISQRCLNAIAPLGVVDDGFGLDYFIGNNDIIKGNDLPTSHMHGFVAIVIGASYYTKKLPVHKLQELCLQIEYPIILIGGKEDEKEGAEIASVDAVKIYNSCGKFSLNESADIVRRARIVISHDTGLQYIACAFNKPVLAIWGGTSPKLDVEPYYGNKTNVNGILLYKNFIVPNLNCQPCSNFGTNNCPKKHFKCMQLQNVEAIAKNAVELLK